MYAASTAAAMRASADVDGGSPAPGRVAVFMLSLVLCDIALSFLRKFDDYRSRSSINVVQ
jgi:hypothetical protein